MSRIGKAPIPIPDGVTVDIKKNVVTVKGPKGELQQKVHPDIKVKVEDGQVVLKRPTDNRHHRAMHGLYRSLIANMVTGVSAGFERKLEIVGVGYRAEKKGRSVVFSLGYSHPIVFLPPEGIEIAVEGPTNVTVSGIDKQLVGQVAAKIRSFRPPEPYKGKGIRYAGEHIRRKAGKSAG
ncbi:MAG TPA: 50S ribosomal protein L6 [Bacteroidetes bacterium]|nr:50S ribosomal protein L6 [Bacteroidota bacterium]